MKQLTAEQVRDFDSGCAVSVAVEDAEVIAESIRQSGSPCRITHAGNAHRVTLLQRKEPLPDMDDPITWNTNECPIPPPIRGY